MSLDNIFFPLYKSVQVKKPVFILDHPRSGTTFLHHLLSSTGEVATFKMWYILFPALTARFLVKPLIKSKIRKGKSELMPEWTGHKVDLDQAEEEELLFLQHYNTQFTTAELLSLDDKEYLELHFQDQQPRLSQTKSLHFFNGCLQRHIAYTGREQIIAQTHYSTMRIKTMMEFYHDAKFIFVVRSPHSVVPSYFSLLHKSIDFC